MANERDGAEKSAKFKRTRHLHTHIPFYGEKKIYSKVADDIQLEVLITWNRKKHFLACVHFVIKTSFNIVCCVFRGNSQVGNIQCLSTLSAMENNIVMYVYIIAMDTHGTPERNFT